MLSALMTIPTEVRKKFYTLRVLAAVLLASAAVLFILPPHNFAIRSLCLVAGLISVEIVRRSDALVRRAWGQVGGEWSPVGADNRVGPLAWTVTASLLVACVVCYFLMYLDALHGGKEAWLAYAFAGAVLAFAVTSAYVVAKISR